MIYIGLIRMDFGQLLLLLGLVALLIDICLVILGEYLEKWETFSEMSFSVGIIAIIISFLYFSYSILIADYSFAYVSSYVSNDMDFFLRLSAIWSGLAGSYFFWTFLAAVIYIVFRLMFREYAHETIFWRSFVLSAIQLAALVVLTLLCDPFKINVRIFSDGLGLNPLLMTYWNVVHPPVVFIGYALCLVPMAIGIARISTLKDGKVPNFEGKEKVDNFFEFMVSLAWLILSSGIIIGAYWAYITLGWGGFWAWDPVETASLIPWLFLTLFFHGKRFYRKNEYFGNYIISMSYISTLFVTYITRSNIILSVHSYRPEATLEKFLKIIIPENTFIMSIILRFIPDERTLFLFIVLSVTFIIPHFYGIKSREIFRLPFSLTKKDFQASKSRITALKISFISFLLGTYIVIIGLVSPVIYDIIGYIVTFSPQGFGSSISVGKIFYNTILTIFGGTMLLAQFFCTFYPRLSIKKKFSLLISGLVAGLVFTISGILYREGEIAISGPFTWVSTLVTTIFKLIVSKGNPVTDFLSRFWTTSDKANLVLPLLLLGMVGLIIEFINVALKEEKNLIRKTSQIMLHFSFLIILLGALLSANMTTTYNIEGVLDGNEYPIPGTSLTITILDLDKTLPESGLHVVEYDTNFMLSSGARVIGYGISRLSYDKENRKDQDVTILSDLFTDIYITTTTVYEEAITRSFMASSIQIKIIPYVTILWLGCLLLHFAIIPLTIGRFILLREAFSSKNKREEHETGKDSSKEVIVEKVVN